MIHRFFLMHNLQVDATRLCLLLFFLLNVQLAQLFQPQNTRWMNAFERRLAQARIAEDAGEADKDNVEDS